MRSHSAATGLGAIIGAVIGVAIANTFGGAATQVSAPLIIGIIIGGVVGAALVHIIVPLGPGTIKHPSPADCDKPDDDNTGTDGPPKPPGTIKKN